MGDAEIIIESLPCETTPPGRIWMRHAWIGYILLIYAYLYLCMFFGEPFNAFDHENYIQFLNEPFPFFFEPGYTAVAYIINALVDDSARFPTVFVVFTLPPLLWVWLKTAGSQYAVRGMMIFACILTKSFYIGFIAQRFFFAELLLCSLIIASMPRFPKYSSMLAPGMVHFSALTIVPSIAWLSYGFSWKKLIGALGLLSAAYVYIRVLSGYQLLGYDYSRYLDGEATDGFPLISLIQMMVLGLICFWILPKKEICNFISLVGIIFLIKYFFSDIEVFSRIFQIQTDLVLIFAGMYARSNLKLIYFFCLGFLVLQVLFTSTASEMVIHHSVAVLNTLHSF